MVLQEEIKNGGSRTLEYKVELPEDSSKWIKTIVAFANGAGGKFIVGVNNSREFIGIPQEVDLFELKDGIADTIAQLCEPQVVFDITAEIIKNAQLLIIQVYPGKRTGQRWKKIKSIFVKISQNVQMGKHDYTSRIQCARFRGTERIEFMDKKEYEGPLCEQIDLAYKFVLNYLSMAIEINGIVHDEKYELPPQAIRELIINAAVHRNYQMSSSIQIAVYDDRVEISSPGSLYGTLTLEEALSGRYPIRNRTIARTFEKIGIVEGWGSGLKRIIGMCDMLRVNFYRPSYKRIGDNGKREDYYIFTVAFQCKVV
jgi:predicted HTH transcriptional regulator